MREIDEMQVTSEHDSVEPVTNNVKFTQLLTITQRNASVSSVSVN